MSKKAKEIKAKKIKLISFWSMIGFITLAFVIVLIVMLSASIPVKSYSDIKDEKLAVFVETMFIQEQTTYYAYIYNSKITDENRTDVALELEPVVFNYFNFVKRNSRNESVIRIYGLDMNDYQNRRYIGEVDSIEVSDYRDFSIKDKTIPLLVKITGGQIIRKYETIQAIQNELQTAMADTVG